MKAIDRIPQQGTWANAAAPMRARLLIVGWLFLAGQAWAGVCDLDHDGDIDRDDLTLIQQAILARAKATGPDDPRDADGNALINSLDGRLCALQCTRPKCSISNSPPTVSLSAPAANQAFTAPATITITATAADSDGRIAKVEFFQGDTLVGTATAAAYTVTWSNVPAGSYTLTAKATDDQGAATISAMGVVTVTVATGATQIYYLHTDHLNTPRAVADEANRVVWRNLPLTEPFGMSLPEEDADGDGRNFTLNLRMPGQYADRESNLNYNYFRDYDPETGRYFQSDPIGLRGGVNTYGYVGGGPANFTDPLGLDPWFKESMRVYTDISKEKTAVFDPSKGKVLEIETRNVIASSAQAGAADPYRGDFTYCEHISKSAQESIKNAFGPLKWRTTDPRGRWIHGGGTGLAEPYSDKNQGWKPTVGCTRAQNEDVRKLCETTGAYAKQNPGKKIVYERE